MCPQRGSPFFAVLFLAACGDRSFEHEERALRGARAGDALTRSAIRHVVVIEQENHTFDTYFGRYCVGEPGVACNQGPACCEAAPAQVGDCTAGVVDDDFNGSFDPDHGANREWQRMNLTDGTFRMDGFPCSNIAYAETPDSTYLDNPIADAGYPLRTHHHYAATGALADRYFQPIVGASSSNDMFLARAAFVFQDNQATPSSRQYIDPTIGNLMNDAEVSWQVYMEGFDSGGSSYPDGYDPTDNPFNYYKNSAHKVRDYRHFAGDIEAGRLPAVTYVRGEERHMEHPGSGIRITDGEAFVRTAVDTLLGTPYANDTLILLTWDEGGGYYDHVSPPLTLADGTPLPATPLVQTGLPGDRSTLEDGTQVPTGTGDPEYYSNENNMRGQEYYGTRLPLLALGPFARANYISHVPLEHSSIVKLIEWNWLSDRTLGTRDAHVRTLGSLLAPTLGVPE